MTETELAETGAPVGLRGRLRRRLRRHRAVATRDALCGLAVTAAITLGNGALSPTLVDVGSATTSDAVARPADAQSSFTAAFVGDVMFGRHVGRVVARHGPDAPLRAVAPLLDADYVGANLEQVLSDRDDLPDAHKLIRLRSPTSVADALARAGITTVSLANNHTMDHGIPGLRDTVAALDAAGLAYAGAGVDLDAAVATDLQEHDGLAVATLSFTDVFVEGFIARAFQGGVLQAEPEVFGPLLQRARAQADLVIVNFHWGEEYDFGPRRRQRELAELAARAGADIVVGHHPHVLQPVERIGSTLVLYSLGNFVFDQGWSRTRESVIARYALTEDGTARVELVPVYIREGTPRQLAGPLATYRRERIFQRLRGPGLRWEREGARLVTVIDHSHVRESPVTAARLSP